MFVRYNGKRTFKVWQIGDTWYGAEMKHIVKGCLEIPLKDCFRGSDVNSIVDSIHTRCRFDELLDNGMNKIEAMRIATFGE